MAIDKRKIKKAFSQVADQTSSVRKQVTGLGRDIKKLSKKKQGDSLAQRFVKTQARRVTKGAEFASQIPLRTAAGFTFGGVPGAGFAQALTKKRAKKALFGTDIVAESEAPTQLTAEEQGQGQGTSGMVSGIVRSEAGGDVPAGMIKVFDADGNSELITNMQFAALQEAKKLRALGGGKTTGASPRTGEIMGDTTESFAPPVSTEGLTPEQAMTQRLLGSPPEPPPITITTPDVENRNIWASTFREAAIPSIIQGGVAGATLGIGVALAPGITAPLAPLAAVVGFVGGVAQRIYATYKANQKEEVSNAWQGFRGLKTNVTRLAPMVNAGAMSAQQAMVNLEYAETRSAYYEAQLRQKERDGDFVADISDYDGKMAYLIEWRQTYLASVRAEVEFAIRNRGYVLQEIYIPDFEDLE